MEQPTAEDHVNDNDGPDRAFSAISKTSSGVLAPGHGNDQTVGTM